MWTAVVAEAVAAVLLVVQLMVIGAFAVVDLLMLARTSVQRKLFMLYI